MRVIKFLISMGLVFVVSLFFPYGSQGAESAGKENHCFTCHTDAKELIKIIREIARADKGKPGASVATEGEG
jgi:hypothetical protein